MVPSRMFHEPTGQGSPGRRQRRFDQREGGTGENASLTRSSIGRLETGMTAAERRTWLEVMSKKRARVVLSSGGLAPVLDFGGGEHSVFAKALLEVLEANRDLLTGRSLHDAVAARVVHAAADYDFEQLPQYAPIARAGHEAGDFLLLPM